MMCSVDYTSFKILEKINLGEDLLTALQEYNNIKGIDKLYRKINQELKFLKKIAENKSVKNEHLQCSNLTHFSAILDTLKVVQNCQSVCEVFLLDDRKLTVDIVLNNGLTWMKVIARNPRSLSQACMGDASYGARSIVDQAEEFTECVKYYRCNYQVPKIVFVFTKGISIDIAELLENQGIIVQGNRISEENIIESNNITETEETEFLNNLSQNDSVPLITKLNLDVSAMLAFCSSITNGGANIYKYNTPILIEQASMERAKPLKPILEEFIKNKTLYCCQTAYESFMEIVNIVGGPTEKIRAQKLLEEVEVLPDDYVFEGDTTDEFEFNEINLPVGGKIKERSLTIFMFGNRIHAVTVTSNIGFVRAAKQQGVSFVVFTHESRALTEQKEQKMELIS